MKARIEVFQGISRLWYFRVVAANSRTVAQSEGYVSRSGALRGVKALKRAAAGEATLV